MTAPTATTLEAHLARNGVEAAAAVGRLFRGVREVQTKHGLRLAVDLDCNGLWEPWKAEKPALKKAGVQVGKFRGYWKAVCWMKPEAVQAAKQPPAATFPAPPVKRRHGAVRGLNGEVHATHSQPASELEVGQAVAINTTAPEGMTEAAYAAGGLTAVEAQRQGVHAVLNAALGGGKGFMLADQMGSGKTLQSILIAKELMRRGEVDNVVVLTKASLCSMWQERLEASGIATEWIKDSKGLKVKRTAVLTNYTLAVRAAVLASLALFTTDRTLVILDEAHAVKSTGFTPSKISQLVWGFGKDAGEGLARQARFTLGLSGTPMPNGKASELHGLLSTATDAARDYIRYGEKFCGLEKQHVGRGRMVWVETANTCHAEFRELYHAVKIQRPVSAFADLPELTLTTHHMAPTREVLRAQEELEREVPYDDIVSAIGAGDSPPFSQFAKVMRLIGMTKAQTASKLVIDQVNGSGAMVVFTRHNDVLAEIKAELEKAGKDVVTMTASMDGEARGEAVRRFQGGEGQVFLTTLGVAAEGITLTRASQALLVELDCVPAKIDQAIARIHRMGQDANCQVHRLLMESTIDDRLADIIYHKTACIKELT